VKIYQKDPVLATHCILHIDYVSLKIAPYNNIGAGMCRVKRMARIAGTHSLNKHNHGYREKRAKADRPVRPSQAEINDRKVHRYQSKHRSAAVTTLSPFYFVFKGGAG